MSAPGTNPNQISCPPAEQDRIRSWMLQARSLGLAAEFRAAVNDILHHLRFDPTEWGDPLYRFHQLGLLRRRGLNAVRYVYYAVDEALRIVYVQRFFLRPGHPLEAST
jgi:hypothetical protein